MLFSCGRIYALHARLNIPFVQVLNISYSEAMKRALFPMSLIFPAMLVAAAAQAEDTMPPLPPPANVENSPAALETVAPPPASEDGLSGQLSAPEGDANVEIHSTIREDGTRIEEYARQGRVYMVKVTPPHDMPPYYLYDNNGDGQFERRLGGNKRPSPPEWVIKRF